MNYRSSVAPASCKININGRNERKEEKEKKWLCKHYKRTLSCRSQCSFIHENLCYSNKIFITFSGKHVKASTTLSHFPMSFESSHPFFHPFFSSTIIKDFSIIPRLIFYLVDGVKKGFYACWIPRQAINCFQRQNFWELQKGRKSRKFACCVWRKKKRLYASKESWRIFGGSKKSYHPVNTLKRNEVNNLHNYGR